VCLRTCEDRRVQWGLFSHVTIRADRGHVSPYLVCYNLLWSWIPRRCWHSTPSGCPDRRLSRGETRHRNTKRGAAYIVQLERVAELDGPGVPSVLSAYTDLEAWASASPHVYRLPHDTPDSILVEGLEWIRIQNPSLQVAYQEASFGIVS
jgi:hypothetical protein